MNKAAQFSARLERLSIDETLEAIESLAEKLPLVKRALPLKLGHHVARALHVDGVVVVAVHDELGNGRRP